MQNLTNRVVRAARWLAPLSALAFVCVALSWTEAPAQSPPPPPPPSLLIADAPQVTPSAAWSYYSGLDLASPTRTTDPLIQRTATALGNDPTRIYEFVYNTMEVVPLFGVQKGARGCLIDKACTPFDQAHLLVELLRAAGQTASYKLGEATMSASQVGQWLGISGTTSIDDVLADGGTPFLASGGNYTILTMWVETTVGGQLRRLDPSFKAYTDHAGLSTPTLDSAMGFTASGFMSSALSGASSSVTSGVPQVSTFNRTNVRANLQSYSQGLLTYIRTNNASSETIDVVGGREIAPLQGGLPTTPGYSLGTVRATFNNDVPLVLRTQMTIRIGGSGAQMTLPGVLDEDYGEELALIPMEIFPTPPQQSQVTFKVYRNGVAEPTEMVGASAAIQVEFNHPYAANGGAFLDRTLDTISSFNGGMIQVIIGGGRMTSGFGAYMEARSSAREGFVEYTRSDEEATKVRIGSQRATKRRYAAAFASQFSSAIGMTEEIGDATIAVHDLVIVAQTLPPLDIAHSMSTIGSLTVRGAFAANADSGDAAQTLAVRRTVAALSGALEASAVAQTLDSVYTLSTATRFDWFSDSTENAAANRTFYWANSTNWTQVSALIQNDDYYNNSQSRGIAENYVNAGYTVIIPRSSDLGPGLKHPVTTTSPGPERGVAIVALSPSGIAHVVTAQFTELKGGGGSNDAETNPTRVLAIPEDFLERQFTSRAEAYNVDMATGAVSYTPPPDLVVGEGDYPYSLSFQRSYRSGAVYDPGAYETPEDIEPLQPWEERFADSGWTSNFMAEARMANDGQRAFGDQSSREATDTIVVVRVLLALSVDQGSDLATLQYQLGGLHALAWWSDQLAFNTVQVVHGPDNRSFFQLADGTFQGPPGDSTQLQLAGQRSIYKKILSAVSRWDYRAMCVTETGHDGSVSYYGAWNSTYTTCNAPSGPNPSRGQKWWRFRHQVFPRGVVVDFDDTTLSNNLGRSITMSPTTAASNQPPYLQYTVRDGAVTTRSVAITLDMQTQLAATTGPGVMSVTGADGATWVYDGSTDANWRIFAPSSSSVPIVTFSYATDTRGQVYTLADALSHTAQYWISTGRIGAMVDPLSHATRTYYDQHSQPVRVTNRLGYDTLTQYDAFRRVSRVTNPEGDYVVYAYDARNNRTDEWRHSKDDSQVIHTAHTDYDTACNLPTLQRDALNNETTYTLLSGRCLIASVTQPAVDDGTTSSTSLVNPVTEYTWNSLGQVLSKTDPTGRETRSGYNATTHYLETVTVENGSNDIVTTFGRNTAGDITSVTDPNSHVFTGTYDSSRRLTRYDGPTGTNAATEWRYNSDGLIDRIRQATGQSSPNDWSTTTYTYFPTARVQSMTDPDGGLTQYSYDALNRADCVAVRMNPAVYSSIGSLSACSLSTQGSNGPDRVTRTEYDAEGQVTLERRAYGTSLAQIYATRTWTANGKLDTVEDANGNRSNFDYDGFDRLARLYFPNGTLGSHTSSTTDYEEYGYDPNSNRTSLRLRSSESIGYSYDALNREIFKDIPGGTSADVSSRYDLSGRRVLARFSTTVTPSSDCTANNSGVDYCYDAVGRLQYETSYGRRLAFQYDQASNRTRITHPDSNYFSYTYDALNRVDQVQLNGSSSGLSLIADYDYDPMSRRTALTRGNGAATTYGYSQASRLTSLVHNLEGSTNDANWAFSYNVAGQVTSRSLVQVYETTTSSLNQAYTADGLNRYSTVGGAAFNYDGRQNLISDGSRNFSYDYENRLTSASGSVSGTLSYDPLGRLHSYASGGTTTEFLYDGDRLVAEYVSGSVARRYAHGAGVDEPLIWYEGSGVSSGQNWLIADRQGSIIATTNASGTATTYAYDAYGIPREWSGPGGAMLSRFRYTGQAALPELHLYHYKARVYDPGLGRFLQTDPVGYRDDMDLYSYVQNDPIDREDPTGLGGRWRQVLREEEENGDIPPGAAQQAEDFHQNFVFGLITLATSPFFASRAAVPGAWAAVTESMSERALAFQVSQGGRAGFAYVVNGVKFDAFAGGRLIEAKSSMAQFVRNGQFQPWFRGAGDLVNQATRQLAAAGRTPVVWRVEGRATSTAISNLLRGAGITEVRVETVTKVCTGTRICP